MVGVFVAFIRVVYGRIVYMSLSHSSPGFNLHGGVSIDTIKHH